LLQAILSEEQVVLLIDEVDRIEVETEALLLEVLSDFQVSIPELGTLSAKTMPSVYLTSNNTRELSEALKRRCVFLDIDYPTIEREQAIIEARIPGIAQSLAVHCAEVVSWIRSFELKKPPSVSETLDWARTLLVLGREELTQDDIRATMNLLLKYSGDIDKISEALRAAGTR
jgi:MoxR-like ATPase